MTFAIGVDGGGTLARAVIVDVSGRELGRAEAPGAVVTERTPEVAAAAVAEAVRNAAREASVALPAAVLWAGLAGAGQEGSRLAAERALSRAGLATRVRVGTDIEAAFFAAFPDGPGLMLLAGTGSIAWGRGPSGSVVRVGGWGQHLGDEGSGYAIGLEALRAIARAEDGREGPTSLREGVLRTLGLERAEDLVPWAASASKADVAALAQVVADAAGAGDRAADGILSGAVEQIEAHLAAIVRRAGPWSRRPGLLLAGGLIGPGGALRERLVARLAAHRVELCAGEVDGAVGAAQLALATLRGS